LFLVCNAFTEDQIAYNLAVSRRVGDKYIENLHDILDVKKREDLLRKEVKLKWVNPEHLYFHGTDIEIPPHPAKKRGNRNKIVPGRKAVNY
jgi:hypothetical protein